MFRLEERQLHILMLMILGASVVLFSILGIDKLPVPDEQGGVEGMTDFSEGWICAYETDDMQKYQEYRSTEENSNGNEDKIIREVVTFPSELPVAKGKTLSLLHQVPDMDLNTMYLLVKTEQQSIRVIVGTDVIYESSKKEERIPSYHMIAVPLKYKNQMFTIELTSKSGKDMRVDAIYAGTRNQLLVDLLTEDGTSVVRGMVLICISFCMLLFFALIKNTWKQKRLLLYTSLEGIALGLLSIMEGTILPVLTGWNYGIYLLRCCIVILAAVLHLMVIRCFINRKKILALLDTGTLVYGIFYISVMVLQIFTLIRFDTIYFLGKLLFGIGILFYTIVLAVSVYRYKWIEHRPVFYANGILILFVIVQLIVELLIKDVSDDFYIAAGFGVYMVFVWVLGVRRALSFKSKKATVRDEEEIRAQIVEQMNPNLLFASFHTLQNLIKSGSEKSIKMIYYISVYFRDNLKALEQTGEMIPFEEELEHILAYLQLQRTRNVNLNFILECKVKEFFIPRHSIEPMVENAVKYGIAKHDNRGNIVIRTYLRAEGYAIQVVDDGIGFDKKILKRQSPTALLNLLDGLENACQAQTEVVSKEGKGTVITIILPMLDNELLDEEDSLES